VICADFLRISLAIFSAPDLDRDIASAAPMPSNSPVTSNARLLARASSIRS